MNRPGSFETTTPKQLKLSMMEILPGEEVLKKELAQFLWNPIGNPVVEYIEEAVCVGRYFLSVQKGSDQTGPKDFKGEGKNPEFLSLFLGQS